MLMLCDRWILFYNPVILKYGQDLNNRHVLSMIHRGLSVRQNLKNEKNGFLLAASQQIYSCLKSKPRDDMQRWNRTKRRFTQSNVVRVVIQTTGFIKPNPTSHGGKPLQDEFWRGQGWDRNSRPVAKLPTVPSPFEKSSGVALLSAQLLPRLFANSCRPK